MHLLWLLEPYPTAIDKILANGVIADFYCDPPGSTSTPPSIPRTVRDRADPPSFEIEIDHYDLSDATDVE